MAIPPRAGDWRTAGGLVELHVGCGLRYSDMPGDDVRRGVVLSSYRRSAQSAQHRELPDVRERTGDGLLGTDASFKKVKAALATWMRAATA